MGSLESSFRCQKKRTANLRESQPIAFRTTRSLRRDRIVASRVALATARRNAGLALRRSPIHAEFIFFCERRSASQASRRALAISRETDLWEVESEGTRCDWLRFAWIGGLFQIRRNSKKKYCRKGFLLLPCSLREASQAFGLLPP